MKKRTVWIFVAAALSISLGCAWFQPYYTLHMIQSAARSGDSAALAQYVDFPGVRESVRSQLTAKVDAKVRGSGLMANLGRSIMTGLITQMVDALVTPEGIVQLVKGESGPAVEAVTAAPATEAPSSPPPTGASTDAKATRRHSRGHYVGFNRFEVDWYVGDEPSAAPKLILMRAGLGWRLVALDLGLGPPASP